MPPITDAEPGLGNEYGDWVGPEPRLTAFAPFGRAAAHYNPPVARRRTQPRQVPPVPAPEQIFVPHWDDDDGEIWDYLTLGQFTFAGTVRIQGEGPKLSVDKRKRKGANGSKLVTNGYDTSELKLVLRVWTKEHLEDYSALVSEVHPKRTGKPFALDVYHPTLALAKIDKVLVYGVGFLLPTGTHGLFESVLSCFEYQEPDATKNATQRVQHRPATNNEPAFDPFFHTQSDNPRSSPTPSATNSNP